MIHPPLRTPPAPPRPLQGASQGQADAERTGIPPHTGADLSWPPKPALCTGILAFASATHSRSYVTKVTR